MRTIKFVSVFKFRNSFKRAHPSFWGSTSFNRFLRKGLQEVEFCLQMCIFSSRFWSSEPEDYSVWELVARADELQLRPWVMHSLLAAASTDQLWPFLVGKFLAISRLLIPVPEVATLSPKKSESQPYQGRKGKNILAICCPPSPSIYVIAAFCHCYFQTLQSSFTPFLNYLLLINPGTI